MAKPGPKVGGPIKGSPKSIRFEHELAKKLEKAAALSERSFSDEVGARLDASFQSKKDDRAWGSRETHAFFVLMADTLSELRRDTGESWWNDPFTFEHAKRAVSVLMDAHRPVGEPVVPPDLPERNFKRRFGLQETENVALRWFGVIAAARSLDDLDRHLGKRGESELQYIRETGREDAVNEFRRKQKVAEVLRPKVFRAGIPAEIIKLQTVPGASNVSFGFPGPDELRPRKGAKRKQRK